MILPDVNVLLHALRADSTEHDRARSWLEEVHAGSEPIALCPQVVSGLLRNATSPRVFTTPTPVGLVWEWLAAARSSPLHRFVSAGPRHLHLLERLCRESGARGNLVPDAAIAAVAIENGCSVVSTDGDFARFPSVRWTRPWSL